MKYKSLCKKQAKKKQYSIAALGLYFSIIFF